MNTLDYIPTPTLASFEQVGVTETIPGSTYVSATVVPPQLSAITVTGNTATFTYYEPVVCQANSGDPATISPFTSATPYNNLTAAPRLRLGHFLPFEHRRDLDHRHLVQRDPRQLRPPLQRRRLRPGPLYRRSPGKRLRRRARGLTKRLRRRRARSDHTRPSTRP